MKQLASTALEFCADHLWLPCGAAATVLLLIIVQVLKFIDEPRLDLDQTEHGKIEQ